MHSITRAALLSVVALAAGLTVSAQAQTGPSFKCSANMASSVETLICSSEGLASLDRQMASTYSAALKKAGSQAKMLKAEQRGWIKGRNDCWKADDKQACIRDSYNQRLTELQKGYGVVTSTPASQK
ncbi:lysozyme inhibitor LprI family protein [Pseudomonas sp. LG1D9]|uniref:lysozyme inhibitor LprI family protein n=1 Tax=Pseudomonas sp. LG1D9 TaxID=2083054 RepID=UPI000CF34169|nr:lysozyme inhibitor LprI family protein [Pseudomonas sp. LG1D9]